LAIESSAYARTSASCAQDETKADLASSASAAAAALVPAVTQPSLPPAIFHLAQPQHRRMTSSTSSTAWRLGEQVAIGNRTPAGTVDRFLQQMREIEARSLTKLQSVGQLVRELEDFEGPRGGKSRCEILSLRRLMTIYSLTKMKPNQMQKQYPELAASSSTMSMASRLDLDKANAEVTQLKQQLKELQNQLEKEKTSSVKPATVEHSEAQTDLIVACVDKNDELVLIERPTTTNSTSEEEEESASIELKAEFQAEMSEERRNGWPSAKQKLAAHQARLEAVRDASCGTEFG
uniref:ENTH domain-containing protein n=1 Tax=Macrostomum lignano TaxID=282301 RepID=A0A1I8F7S0_9PLAT